MHGSKKNIKVILVLYFVGKDCRFGFRSTCFGDSSGSH